MLIITRKRGESLIIGDDIEIVINKIEDGSVKIGINAPKDVSVLRKELYEQVKKENKEAINVDINLLEKIKKK